MSNDTLPNRTSTPWHIWVIGVIVLFLYAIGAYDYVQTQTKNTNYFESQGYGPAQIEYFTNYPVVPLAFWTVNIIFGLLTAVLLLMRSRWSVGAAATAAVSGLCLQIITFGFMDRWNILGPRLSIPDIVVLLLTFSLWFYCHHMHQRNVLSAKANYSHNT